MPVIPAFQRLRQMDWKLQDSLGNRVRAWSKKSKKQINFYNLMNIILKR
jgi:hypothetical protein